MNTLRTAMEKVRAHTSYVTPSIELLAGLLASIERIADAALSQSLVGAAESNAPHEIRTSDRLNELLALFRRLRDEEYLFVSAGLEDNASPAAVNYHQGYADAMKQVVSLLGPAARLPAGTSTQATMPDEIATRAEALWEELGGDLCICQRLDVPHWCESCRRRIDLIATAFRRLDHFRSLR
jgi:hypothetical protein